MNFYEHLREALLEMKRSWEIVRILEKLAKQKNHTLSGWELRFIQDLGSRFRSQRQPLNPAEITRAAQIVAFQQLQVPKED